MLSITSIDLYGNELKCIKNARSEHLFYEKWAYLESVVPDMDLLETARPFLLMRGQTGRLPEMMATDSECTRWLPITAMRSAVGLPQSIRNRHLAEYVPAKLLVAVDGHESLFDRRFRRHSIRR